MKQSNNLSLGFAIIVLLLPTVLSTGCQQKTSVDSSTLAVFEGGSISTRDLDQAILALPPSERQTQIQSKEQLENIIRRLAFKKLMVKKLQNEGFEENEQYRVIRDQLQEETTVALYLNRDAPPKAIADEDIAAWLKEHPEYERREPSRLVYTFFRSFRPGLSHEESRKEVEAIRKRIGGGESFPHIAETESDSETRHHQGLLGWFSPGRLPAELDRIVFSLEEGEISKPIMTQDGAHLFWVKTVIPGRVLSRNEIRQVALPTIISEKRTERIGKALKALGGQRIDLPSQEQLKTVLVHGDSQTILLSSGGRRLTVGNLRQLLEYRKASGTSPYDLLRDIALTAPLRQIIDEKKLIPQEDVERWINPLLEQERLNEFTNTLMRKWLEAQEEKLRSFYDNEKARFQTPLRLHILKLVVPLGQDPVGGMRRLEELSSSSKVASLPGVARSIGGSVEDLGMGTLPQLLRKDHGVLAALSLAEGTLSSPHRDEEGLVLYGLAERIEPEPLSFEKAKALVVATMLSELGDELSEEFTRTELASTGFQLFQEHIENCQFGRASRKANDPEKGSRS